MTIVNTTSIFPKNEYKEMVEEWANKNTDKELLSYINYCLNNIDFVEGVDYGQVLKVRKHFMNRNKNTYKNGDWFGRKL